MPERRPYRLLGTDGGEESIILRGGFFMARFRSGVQVHGTDAVEEVDGAAELQLPPQLSVSVVLDGPPTAFLDDTQIGARSGPSVQGKIWTTTRPALLRRHFTSGQKVRKVHVTVDSDWLETFLAPPDFANDPLNRFAVTHLAVEDWSPSRSALRAAEEMLLALTHQDILTRLSLEMRALSILREALESVSATSTPTCPLDALDDTALKAHSARQYIDRNIDRPLRLPTIASAVGMSVSTLQRAFKDEFGSTVAEHLRSARLDQARRALTYGSHTIQQAANIAGYTSAANFATAFKRRFGYPPSQESGGH